MFLKILDDLRAAFIARDFTEVEIAEGIESRNEQSNFGAGSANRIAFVPAKDMQIIPPTHIGDQDVEGDPERVKRQLFNVMFAFDVYFAGFDADHPERDLAHRRKCFDIWEVTAQEIQRLYAGAFEWSSPQWNDDKKHIRHGAELVATLVLNIPIFDRDWVIAKPSPKPGEPKPVP